MRASVVGAADDFAYVWVVTDVVHRVFIEEFVTINDKGTPGVLLAANLNAITSKVQGQCSNDILIPFIDSNQSWSAPALLKSLSALVSYKAVELLIVCCQV